MSKAGAASPSYDANGNLIGDGSASYRYDAQNRLVGFTQGSVVVSYDYDVEGRRASRTEGGTTRRSLYALGQEIAEYADGVLAARHVPGPGLDEPLATVTGAPGSRVRAWYHTDAQGSVIARSDGSGAVPAGERFSYTPYGVAGSGSGSASAFRFVGRRLEPPVGLYDMRARVYAPGLGRFLQPDPIGTDGGINLYAYVRNDPLNQADPTGLFAHAIAGAIIGVGVEAVAQLVLHGQIQSWATIGTAGLAGAASGGTSAVTQGMSLTSRIAFNSYANAQIGGALYVSNQIGSNVAPGAFGAPTPFSGGAMGVYAAGQALGGALGAVAGAFGARGVDAIFRSPVVTRAAELLGGIAGQLGVGLGQAAVLNRLQSPTPAAAPAAARGPTVPTDGLYIGQYAFGLK
ncbi:RHS repeat-associated core domain-containing protein [Elioraea sp.]|uniref:RHS repeat-associated core domain-containing protein n=1 Tax=Elioraea sp. TaxID=2185103 RepID=UPI003F6FFFCA